MWRERSVHSSSSKKISPKIDRKTLTDQSCNSSVNKYSPEYSNSCRGHKKSSNCKDSKDNCACDYVMAMMKANKHFRAFIKKAKMFKDK